MTDDPTLLPEFQLTQGLARLALEYLPSTAGWGAGLPTDGPALVGMAYRNMRRYLNDICKARSVDDLSRANRWLIVDVEARFITAMPEVLAVRHAAHAAQVSYDFHLYRDGYLARVRTLLSEKPVCIPQEKFLTLWALTVGNR